MFKRCILTASATVFVASLATVANAQLFRACPGGNCHTAAYSRVRVVNVQRVYNPYSYQTATATVAPCEQATETVEAPEPCAPVATVEPCAPVAATCEQCAQGEYVPTEQGGVCVNGTCPIRTAVKVAAKTAHGAVRTVAKTAGWLAAVNRTRAAYGLTALRGDATLDAGCESAANYCASVGGLAHTGGNEILAYNQSGIDAAIESWLNSPAHRAYLLSPNFSTAGISVVRDKHGRVWCAMRFR